jgi:hypothetical protein
MHRVPVGPPSLAPADGTAPRPQPGSAALLEPASRLPSRGQRHGHRLDSSRGGQHDGRNRMPLFTHRADNVAHLAARTEVEALRTGGAAAPSPGEFGSIVLLALLGSG